MNDQKIENLLNLALDATESERERSMELDVGYDPVDRRWDLIVKYSGDIQSLEDENIRVVVLLNEYAIISVPQNMIDRIASSPFVEYIEKPKRLFFAVNEGRRASCINTLQSAQFNLFGQGVITAIIDSGIDAWHPDFINEDGTTRILDIWDQTIQGNPPQGYHIGTEYDQNVINEALSAPSQTEGRSIMPSQDRSGHGTQVAGICCGNGRASGGRYRGVASESEIIVVKLGNPASDSFPRTTELMQAIDYVIRKSIEYQKPVAINLSFGNTYGSHDGTSLIETYIDGVSSLGKSVISIGTGNEGAASGHTSGFLVQGQTTDVEISVSSYEKSLNIQLWKSYVDDFDILLISPNGTQVGPFQNILGSQRFVLENTEILLFYGEPSPYSQAQEIYLDFIPRGDYIQEGIWTIRMVPRRIVIGEYHMWLPSSSTINSGTRFLRPTPVDTLTIPSTASKIISVGAYNSRTDAYADFSGRGNTAQTTQIKPDIVAPGVDITTTSAGGGYTTVSGTSFATPFVTGSAALLMEWGIVEGNDPYLYGEKVKAYLRRGARHLPGFSQFPNPQVGYGALCLRNSLPV